MPKLPFLWNLALTPVAKIQKQSKVFNWECLMSFSPSPFLPSTSFFTLLDSVTWVCGCHVSILTKDFFYSSENIKLLYFRFIFHFLFF